MSSWTDERITRLKTLWLEGHSAAAVARHLGGVTRNAVIGKVHRLGLSGRAVASAPARLIPPPVPRPARARPTPPRLALASRAASTFDVDTFCPAELAEPRVPLLKLGACGCRYGFGDPRSDAFGFCGAPQVRGRYCARHADIVYQPASPARAKADGKLLERVRHTG